MGQGLPDELIVKIFEYLPLSSLIVAGRVCRQWRYCALDFFRAPNVVVEGEDATDSVVRFLLQPHMSINTLTLEGKQTAVRILREANKRNELVAAPFDLTPFAFCDISHTQLKGLRILHSQLLPGCLFSLTEASSSLTALDVLEGTIVTGHLAHLPFLQRLHTLKMSFSAIFPFDEAR